MISYGVIGHEMELGRSALEKYVLTEENILFHRYFEQIKC